MSCEAEAQVLQQALAAEAQAALALLTLVSAKNAADAAYEAGLTAYADAQTAANEAQAAYDACINGAGAARQKKAPKGAPGK